MSGGENRKIFLKRGFAPHVRGGQCMQCDRRPLHSCSRCRLELCAMGNAKNKNRKAERKARTGKALNEKITARRRNARAQRGIGGRFEKL